VADSNVAAQQDGIAALCAFLKFGGRDGCMRYLGDVAPRLDKADVISGPVVIQLHPW
jgi:cytoskeleton-associated protein 5